MPGVISALFALVVALWVASPAVAIAQAAAPLARPALEGAWLLDREASTLPPPGARLGMRPGGGGGRGGTTGGRGGPSRPSEEEIERMRALVQEMLQAPPRMTIARDGEAVIFIDADGRVRKYLPNAKAERHQMNAGTVETRTRWEGPSLVIETTLGEGMTAKRTFALEAGTGRLLVTTTLEGSRSPNDRPPVVAVYDPAM